MPPDESAPTLTLVIDDDEFVRKALGRNLRRLGCEVLIGTNGEEGLRLAVETAPAVIFLDLRMPGMDGHTVLRHLVEADVRSSVIAMSGQGDMDDVIEAMRKGAIDYVKKPWTPDELISALGRGVQMHRARDGRVQAAGRGGRRAADRTPSPHDAVGAWTAADAKQTAPLREIMEWLRAGDVPATPLAPALARLRRLAQVAEPSVDDIARALEGESDLTMTLLRLANSGLHAGGTSVGDVRQAVARVGPRQVHDMAETAALRDAYRVDGGGGAARARQEQIWRFSVARGLAMRAIADATVPAVGLNRNRCYLAGLLLDAGALFLLGTLATRSPLGSRDPNPHTFGAGTLAEVQAYHAAFGQALIARWGLPAEIATLAGDHHGEATAADQSLLWCAAVTAGPIASRLVGGADPTHDRPPRPELLNRCARTLGLGEAALRRLAVGLTSDVRELWAVYA